MDSKLKILGLSCLILITFCTAERVSARPVVNIVAGPDPVFSAHMIGVEGFFTSSLKVGIYAAEASNTKRPTFNLPNENVENSHFKRLATSAYLALDKIYEDGILFGLTYGIESSQFRSDLGSKADVAFNAYGLHAAYQFFWDIGFNIQLSATLANYDASKVSADIALDESEEVRDFLETNTSSNFHPGIGILFGWAF